MPAEYERMRDVFVAQGWSFRDAQRKAAKIYNYRRKRGEKPVGRRTEVGGQRTEVRRQRSDGNSE